MRPYSTLEGTASQSEVQILHPEDQVGYTRARNLREWQPLQSPELSCTTVARHTLGE